MAIAMTFIKRHDKETMAIIDNLFHFFGRTVQTALSLATPGYDFIQDFFMISVATQYGKIVSSSSFPGLEMFLEMFLKYISNKF